MGRAIRNPYILKSITLNWLDEFQKTRLNLLTNISQIRIPILICHGTIDRIANPSGAKLLYEKIEFNDKALCLYEGFKHELFNHSEDKRNKIINDTLEWLNAHCNN